MNKILQIAAELKVRPAQVNAAVELLDGGAAVPFISRYRKEVTFAPLAGDAIGVVVLVTRVGSVCRARRPESAALQGGRPGLLVRSIWV